MAKAKKKASKKKTKVKAKKGPAEARKVDVEILDDDAPDTKEDSANDFEDDIADDPDLSVDIDIPANTSALAYRDPISSYLAEIRRYPLLTKEQEYELAIKYQNTKDPAIAHVLVTSNLRFVVKVAAEYSKFGAKLIDLVQEGNVGLMHAVREFNPYKGVKLITYAVWWIRGYIREYLLKQHSMVKIGTTQAQRKLFYNLAKEKKALEAEGLSVTPELISERLDVPLKDVHTMEKRMSGGDISLDQPVDDATKSTLMDLQTSDAKMSIDDQLSLLEQLDILKRNIEKVKKDLNKREIYLLENRLLSDNPMTLQEVGDKYNITREAVRQMESRLIVKIRNKFFETKALSSSQISKN